ncbi:MAG: hypothetical protein UT54_C0039G0014 [Candidatus Daviesbacteria bacterium GW2011_GWB1_39_5]|nr:MAG: hypothetical protein UT54_C0039G0014 [Candidatus Daviesbacteria bacterium GW2011_GWB1_39_5]
MKKIIDTFQTLTNLQRVLVLIILGVVVYGASTSLSYSLFSRFISTPSVKEGGTSSLPTATTAFVISSGFSFDTAFPEPIRSGGSIAM